MLEKSKLVTISNTRNRIFKLETRFHFLNFCKCNNFHANKLTFSLELGRFSKNGRFPIFRFYVSLFPIPIRFLQAVNAATMSKEWRLHYTHVHSGSSDMCLQRGRPISKWTAHGEQTWYERLVTFSIRCADAAGVYIKRPTIGSED